MADHPKEVIIVLDQKGLEDPIEAGREIAVSPLVRAVLAALGQPIATGWEMCELPLEWRGNLPISFQPESEAAESSYRVRVTLHAAMERFLQEAPPEPPEAPHVGLWKDALALAKADNLLEPGIVRQRWEKYNNLLVSALGLPAREEKEGGSGEGLGGLRPPGDLIVAEARMGKETSSFCTPLTIWYAAMLAFGTVRREHADLQPLEEAPVRLPRILLAGWRDSFLSFVGQCLNDPGLGSPNAHLLATYLAEAIQSIEELTSLRPSEAPRKESGPDAGVSASARPLERWAATLATASPWHSDHEAPATPESRAKFSWDGSLAWETAVYPFLWSHFPDLFFDPESMDEIRARSPHQMANFVDYGDPLWPEWVQGWLHLLLAEAEAGSSAQQPARDPSASRRIRHWYYIHLTATQILPVRLRARETLRFMGVTAEAYAEDFEVGSVRQLKELGRAIRSDLHGSKQSHDVHGDLFTPPWPAPASSLVRRVFELRQWFAELKRPPRFIFVDNAPRGETKQKLNEKLRGIYEALRCICVDQIKVGLPESLDSLRHEIESRSEDPDAEKLQQLVEQLEFIARRAKEEFRVPDELPARHVKLDFCLYRHDLPGGTSFPGHEIRNRILDHILKKSVEPDLERRYLFLDFILASKDSESQDEVVYLANQFLADLVRRKQGLQKQQAVDLAKNRARDPGFRLSSGPEWGMVVSKHHFNTNAYIEAGVFNLLFGHISLHPGENPISLIRRIPMLLKVVSLIESSLNLEVDAVIDDLSAAVNDSLVQGWADDPFFQLKRGIASLAVSIDRVKRLLTPSRALPERVERHLFDRLKAMFGYPLHKTEKESRRDLLDASAALAGSLEQSLSLQSKGEVQRALSQIQSVIVQADAIPLGLLSELGKRVHKAVDDAWKEQRERGPAVDQGGRR